MGDSLEEAQSDPDQHQAHRGETNSGGYHHHHYKARLEKGDPPLNVSEWVQGSSQPLWVKYTSSCCFAQAELLVWDAAGNMKRCHLTSGEQRQLGDMSTETSGAGQITLTGFFFIMSGLLCSPLL